MWTNDFLFQGFGFITFIMDIQEDSCQYIVSLNRNGKKAETLCDYKKEMLTGFIKHGLGHKSWEQDESSFF